MNIKVAKQVVTLMIAKFIFWCNVCVDGVKMKSEQPPLVQPPLVPPPLAPPAMRPPPLAPPAVGWAPPPPPPPPPPPAPITRPSSTGSTSNSTTSNINSNNSSSTSSRPGSDLWAALAWWQAAREQRAWLRRAAEAANATAPPAPPAAVPTPTPAAYPTPSNPHEGMMSDIQRRWAERA